MYRFDSDVDVEQSAQGDIYVNGAGGEFLTYTVSVPAAGNFDILARVSSPFSGSRIGVSVAGVDQTGVVSVPNTGSFENWRTVTLAQNVPLSQGVQQVRGDMAGIAFSVDTISISDLLCGDVSLDGFVNFLDIAPFIELLSSNTYLEQADCNQDGVLDFLDIAFFIDILAAQ